MTTKKTASVPGDENEKEPEAHWQFRGSSKALEALSRRDEAQANALAEAMRMLQRTTARGKNSQTERKLLEQVRKLKRALRHRHRGPGRRPLGKGKSYRRSQRRR